MTLEQLKTRLEIAKKREKWGVVDDVIDSLEERMSDGHDLPTAAVLLEGETWDGEPCREVGFDRTTTNLSDHFNPDTIKEKELVTREDAEQEIERRDAKKAMEKEIALQDQRREVLDLIDQKISGLMGDKWTKEAVDDLLEELREEVEQE